MEQYEIERARRPLPAGLGVVPGSTAITAFGRFDSARVASVGINPSHQEFLGRQKALLVPHKARFISRVDLGVADDEELSESQARQVIAASREYFGLNPYRPWFNPMEKWIVSAFGASYYTGSATHLDLSQWATDPVWKYLEQAQQEELLARDVGFLKTQLLDRRFETVVLNGKSAITEVMRTGLVTLQQVDLVHAGGVSIEIWAGEAFGSRFLGWNRYLQSAMRSDARAALSAHLHRMR